MHSFESLSDDLLHVIFARVHRLNFEPVLEEIKKFPSFFEWTLRKGGNVNPNLRCIQQFEEEWYAGSSKLILFGTVVRKFVLMYVDSDSDEGYLCSEGIFEGFLENGKIKIERAHATYRYRRDPDVEFNTLREIIEAGHSIDSGYETDPGRHWGIGKLCDAVDTSYDSGRSWQDFTSLWSWYMPPRIPSEKFEKATVENENDKERLEILYEN